MLTYRRTASLLIFSLSVVMPICAHATEDSSKPLSFLSFITGLKNAKACTPDLLPNGDLGIEWEVDDKSVAASKKTASYAIASEYLLAALRPFSHSGVIKLPPKSRIFLVTHYDYLPTYSPQGYDEWSSKGVWMMFEKDQLIVRLPQLAIEYGRYLFRLNLLNHIEEFKKWDDQRVGWISGLCTMSRLSLDQQLICQTAPLKRADTTDREATRSPLMRPVLSFPWHRLIYDYEVAFGVLFAAIAMRDLDLPEVADPRHHTFFEKEVYAQVNVALDGEAPLQRRRPIWEAKTIAEWTDIRQKDPYYNDLRPSIGWIWTHLLKDRDRSAQLDGIEDYFLAAVEEIKARRVSEANGLITDSHINHGLLQRLRANP